MPFCEECGNEITESAKFCPNCGTKTKGETAVTKTIKKKIKKKPEQVVQTSSPKEEQATNDIDEKDTEYLKEFFTVPDKEEENKVPAGWNPKLLKGSMQMFVFSSIYMLIILLTDEDFMYRITCNECDINTLDWVSMLMLLTAPATALSAIAAFITSKNPELVEEWKEYELKILDNIVHNKNEWTLMSPEPLFRRLEQAQRIVADSSFEGLGINKSAKPSEGGVIRTPAYSYGPHLDFTDLIFGKVDKDGIGKGAGYYKICEDSVDGGLYTREYDMMVIQFTQNQILVYKCIFDILEMTKRLEESYEWNYKHVVGINISGDDKEKKLGDSISVTGTKYMVISAASGDKIEIILGAETNELVNGEKKKSHLGGEDKIFEIANAAVKNVREAIRQKAG